MRNFMKLSMAGLVLVLVGGCESTTSSTVPDSGSTSTYGNDSGQGEGEKDGSTTGSDSGGGNACTLPAEAKTDDPKCDGCLQSKCCDKYAACVANAACKKVMDCENACYDMDAGPSASDAGASGDGGDDGGTDPVQTCVNACENGVPDATLSLFNLAGDCYSGSCASSCPQ